jgi:hypothetical protein
MEKKVNAIVERIITQKWVTDFAELKLPRLFLFE